MKDNLTPIPLTVDAPLSLPGVPFLPKAVLITSHLLLGLGWLSLFQGIIPLFGIVLTLPPLLWLKVHSNPLIKPAVRKLLWRMLCHAALLVIFLIHTGFMAQSGASTFPQVWLLAPYIAMYVAIIEATWIYRGMNGLTLRPIIRFIKGKYATRGQ